MDIRLPTSVIPNIMENMSDFVPVSELDSGDALILSSSFTVLPPPPPLIPAPAVIMMEDTSPSPTFLSSITVPKPETEVQPLPIDQEMLGPVQAPSPMAFQLSAPHPLSLGCQPILPSLGPSTGQQMMTRKRSSMSMSSVTNGTSADPTKTIISSTDPNELPTTAAADSLPVSLEEPKSDKAPLELQPPKKKKRSPPKPKKTPDTPSSITGITGVEGASNGKPKTSSKPKKAPDIKGSTVPVDTGNEGEVTKPVKPKRPSRAKAPKKASPAGGGSNKNKSKTGNLPTPTTNSVINKTSEENVELSNPTNASRALVPPLKLQMPKLMKMPIPPGQMNAETEREDVYWDENHGEQLGPVLMAETEMNEDGSEESGNGKGLSRKKKSKGRNGNIYIGVFNRIEWMKLQNEFGFGSVNNFGTFVLQTMRRVHGDIQFWCDVAVASGVYPDLDRYEWTNGCPQAVNKDGQFFTPEADVTMSDEKREEVIEMAKGMWDQRLQELKHQQIVVKEEVAHLDDVAEEEEEEEEDAMQGLENYLENYLTSGNGDQSPSFISLGGGYAHGEENSAGEPSFSAATLLTGENDLDRIWDEQMNDPDGLEKFEKLFSFINCIATMGKSPEDVIEEGLVDDEVGEQWGRLVGGDSENTTATV